MRQGLISCVMCTYGRWTQVQRSMSFFLDQDFIDKELIIFNTADIAMQTDEKVTIVNNSISYKTGLPYTSIGQIRADALTHANGEFYACWDDDDYYHPDHLAQAYNGLFRSGKRAWKPKFSLFSNDGGKTYASMQNNMEASILVFKDEVIFRASTGDEHLPWLDGLRKRRQIEENEDAPPTYAYIWGDGLHKQSGNIDNANNFENHKTASQDFGDGKLVKLDMADYYDKFDRFHALHYSTAGH